MVAVYHQLVRKIRVADNSMTKQNMHVEKYWTTEKRMEMKTKNRKKKKKKEEDGRENGSENDLYQNVSWSPDKSYECIRFT